MKMEDMSALVWGPIATALAVARRPRLGPCPSPACTPQPPPPPGPRRSQRLASATLRRRLGGGGGGRVDAVCRFFFFLVAEEEGRGWVGGEQGGFLLGS